MKNVEIHPTAIVGEGVVMGEGSRVGPFALIEDGVVMGKDTVVWTRAFIAAGTGREQQLDLMPIVCRERQPGPNQFVPRDYRFRLDVIEAC